MLSADDMKTLLKHKRLEVPNEDEAVKALYLWILADAHG
jgi:hypothetical protein